MFDAVKKLKWFFRERKKDYLIAVGSLILVNILIVIPPRLLGKAIDELHRGRLDVQALLFYVAALLCLASMDFGFTVLWIYKLFNNAILLQRNLRRALMEKFLRMTPSFYEKNPTGDLMAKATNDLSSIAEMAGFGVLAFTDATTYMGTILFMMALISWKLTLVCMLPLPLLAIGGKYAGDLIHERYLKAQNAFGEMNDKVLEYVVGVRVVRSYVRERFTEKDLQERTADVFEKNMRVKRLESLFIPAVRLLSAVSYTLAVGYGALLIAGREMTMGDLISFNVYLHAIIWPMIAVGEFISTVQRGNASLDRVMETLNYEEEVFSHGEDAVLDSVAAIEMQSYDFTYPKSSVPMLSGIDWVIEKGSTVGIVGKTGSGKTTLIRQILREYPRGRGHFSIGGFDIESVEKQSLLSHIGYVPQDHVLFSRTIYENILFGKEDAGEEQVMEAVRVADFEKDIALLPMGLETMVGERGISISGGQKQRLSIARAVIKDPEILILDDSLSAVDAATESRIIENIRRNRKGKTTLISAHRLSAVRHADEIIVLDEGRIVERGTHESLMALGGWYREQFDIQKLEEVNA